MRRLAFLLIVVTFTASAANAMAGIKTSDPKKFADKVANRIIEIIESKTSESDKQEDLIQLFKSHVDTNWMGKFVLGKHYKDLGGKETKYQDLYRDYVIYTYIPRFREYSGERMQVVDSVKKGSGEYIVKSVLKTSKSDEDILVDYRLKRHGDTFKIIDVIGEGVSLITTQKSDFEAPISHRGLDFFLGRLEKKVDMLKSR